MSFVKLLKGIDDCGDLLAVLVCHVKKINNLINACVLENQHVFRQNFNEA
jgi:hypothetical protein